MFTPVCDQNSSRIPEKPYNNLTEINLVYFSTLRYSLFRFATIFYPFSPSPAFHRTIHHVFIATLNPDSTVNPPRLLWRLLYISSKLFSNESDRSKNHSVQFNFYLHIRISNQIKLNQNPFNNSVVPITGTYCIVVNLFVTVDVMRSDNYDEIELVFFKSFITLSVIESLL